MNFDKPAKLTFEGYVNAGTAPNEFDPKNFNVFALKFQIITNEYGHFYGKIENSKFKHTKLFCAGLVHKNYLLIGQQNSPGFGLNTFYAIKRDGFHSHLYKGVWGPSFNHETVHFTPEEFPNEKELRGIYYQAGKMMMNLDKIPGKVRVHLISEKH